MKQKSLLAGITSSRNDELPIMTNHNIHPFRNPFSPRRLGEMNRKIHQIYNNTSSLGRKGVRLGLPADKCGIKGDAEKYKPKAERKYHDKLTQTNLLSTLIYFLPRCWTGRVLLLQIVIFTPMFDLSPRFICVCVWCRTYICRVIVTYLLPIT